MDLTKVLEELRRELQHLDSAILTLERLQAKSVRRRGRPPKLLSELRRPLRPEPKHSETDGQKAYKRHPGN
jgi:hypothetical protein